MKGDSGVCMVCFKYSSSGRHYGVVSCEGCKVKRTLMQLFLVLRCFVMYLCVLKCVLRYVCVLKYFLMYFCVFEYVVMYFIIRS